MGGAGLISGGAQRRKAAKKERAAKARRQMLEANRQDPFDPYRDLANPYANLQIATRATEMQAEEADISLASSLDILRATGASAGGATALARAAAQSKRGVAASIEQQEARNAELRAQGEAQAAQLRGQGQMFKYQATEAREMQELNRAASAEQVAQQQGAAAQSQQWQSAGMIAGGLATMATPTLTKQTTPSGTSPTTNPSTQFAGGVFAPKPGGTGVGNFLRNIFGGDPSRSMARQAWRHLQANPQNPINTSGLLTNRRDFVNQGFYGLASSDFGRGLLGSTGFNPYQG